MQATSSDGATLVPVRRMGRHRLTRHALVLAAYSALAVVFTYPLTARLTSHIPGGGDAPWFLWQLWWFKHAMVDLQQSPLVTNLIYHPLNDVPVSWQSPVNELAAAPLLSAIGVVPAYNLLILATFVLAGYTMYLLGVQMLRRRDLAFIAGLIFSFSAYHGTRGLHHLSLATIQWLPLALVTAISCWRKPTVHRGVVAGVAAALVALSSPYYVAYFLTPVGVLAALYALLFRRQALRRAAVWRAGAAGLATAAALTAPFYISLIAAPSDVQEAAREAAASIYVYTADVLSWLLPARDNPLWQAVLASVYDRFTAGYLVETVLFFGFLPLIFSLAALFYRRLPLPGSGFWRMLFVAAMILSLGPILRFWREPLIDWMPYRLLIDLPGSYAFRAPARIGLTAVLAGALLALALVKRLMERRPAWPWRPLLVAWSGALLVNMSVAFPYPTASAALPEAYDAVVAANDGRAVLDLPAGEMFQGRMAWAMAYQTWHHKPLVSGYLGRRPQRLQVPEQTLPFVSRFFRQNWDAYFAGRWQELIDWPATEAILAGVWPEDVQRARSLLSEQGIGRVVLHRDPDNPGFFEPASLLLSQGLGPPAFSSADALRFDVTPPLWTARGATTAIDRAALRYDSRFSAPFLHRQSEARAVSTDAARPAVVTLDLPLAGLWRVSGQLEGANAATAQFLIDDQPLELVRGSLFDQLTAFEAQLDLPAGRHELAIHRPAAAVAARPGNCGDLCLLNLSVSLESPQPVEAGPPLAAFVDSSGRQLQMAAASIAPATPDGASPASLITTWHLPAGSEQHSLPTLYVHITDADGNIVAQADHLLGENSLRQQPSDPAAALIDLVELPVPVAERDLEIRVGLWYPADQTYFRLGEPAETDSAGRLMLGAVGELLEEHPVGDEQP